MQSPHFGALALSACVGQSRKLPENDVEEPTEPDELAFAFMGDSVYPVVPIPRSVQRQAVTAIGKTTVKCACAMLEHGPVLVITHGFAGSQTGGPAVP